MLHVDVSNCKLFYFAQGKKQSLMAVVTELGLPDRVNISALALSCIGLSMVHVQELVHFLSQKMKVIGSSNISWL